MKKSNLIQIFFFSSVTIFLFSVLISSFLFIEKTRKFPSGQVLDSIQRNYQYLGFDEKTNISFTGTVSMLDDLKTNEFISHSRSDGVHILISNFGTEEYKCTGSCFCEESPRRMRLSGTSTTFRGLICLVSSLSLTIAIENARKFFKEECVSRMTEEEKICEDSSKVRSEVNSCDPIVKTTTTRLLSKEFDTYLCQATCLDNERIKRDRYGGEKAVKKKKCHLFFHEAVFDVKHVEFQKETNTDAITTSRSSRSSGSDERRNEYVRYKFMKDYLNPYCRYYTRYSYFRQGILKESWIFVPMCVGEDPATGDNPTIECRLV